MICGIMASWRRSAPPDPPNKSAFGLPGRTDGPTGGRTDEQTDGRTDGRTDGQTDGRIGVNCPTSVLRSLSSVLRSLSACAKAS